MVGGLGAEDMIVELIPLEQLFVGLLLLEQSPEADSEVAGVRVDQDAEAQGDTSQATGPRLRKYFF